MKNKFIFVATLIFTLMLTMTAFAADTWKQTEDGKWYCYDKDDNMIYGEAKKSGTNYYYLDEATGAMVINKLVDLDGNKYWFGADGAKVADQWVQVPVDTDIDENGFKWMYFTPVSGKAMIGDGSFKTINGKKYLFDTDGYMLYGYLTDTTGNKATNVLDAVYYMGTKDEGWQFTGWQKFENGAIDAPGYDEKELVYFYFKNGKKVAAEKDVVEYKVDGVKYYFNEDGSLYTGYQVYATGSVVATGTYYLGKNDDGTMKKNQWVKTSEIKGGDDAYWYYLGKDGRVTTGDATFMKKINGKVYFFAATGEMKTGLAVADIPDYKGYNNPAEEAYVITDKKFASVTEYKKYELGATEKIYYFSTDADNDGAMKTGKQTVTIDDETVDVWFDKHGVAYEGIVKNYIYNNGVLQTGVGVVKCHKDGEYYLVNVAGKILNKTTVRDADGQLWAVDADNNIAKIADQDYAGKCATAWKNGELTFVVSGKTYTLVPGELKDGYQYVKYTDAPM